MVSAAQFHKTSNWNTQLRTNQTSTALQAPQTAAGQASTDGLQWSEMTTRALRYTCCDGQVGLGWHDTVQCSCCKQDLRCRCRHHCNEAPRVLISRQTTVLQKIIILVHTHGDLGLHILTRVTHSADINTPRQSLETTGVWTGSSFLISATIPGFLFLFFLCERSRQKIQSRQQSFLVDWRQKRARPDSHRLQSMVSKVPTSSAIRTRSLWLDVVTTVKSSSPRPCCSLGNLQSQNGVRCGGICFSLMSRHWSFLLKDVPPSPVRCGTAGLKQEVMQWDFRVDESEPKRQTFIIADRLFKLQTSSNLLVFLQSPNFSSFICHTHAHHHPICTRPSTSHIQFLWSYRRPEKIIDFSLAFIAGCINSLSQINLHRGIK